MKTSKWLVITVAAAVSAGGLLVLKTHAAERGEAPRRFRGQLLERAKEKLGLTEDQVSKIKAEFRSDKETLKGEISSLHAARNGLRNAIQAPDASETSVRAASAKVAAAEADLAVERLKLHGRISPILTPEQREKLKGLQAKMDEFVDGVINRIGDRLGTE